ncbi:MAG: hypothetical protein Ct9H300mP11_32630 [Chloroflexota bacterium]|nr:MAG: hypothetical protein Ct9H300mP11_32630 [Chloroflexota bacterium]
MADLRLLACFAHPDDEAFPVGGLLASNVRPAEGPASNDHFGRRRRNPSRRGRNKGNPRAGSAHRALLCRESLGTRGPRSA